MPSYEKNQRAEFFGLPGSGKSTLYNKLEIENTKLYVRGFKYFLFWTTVIVVQLSRTKRFVLLPFKLGLLFKFYNTQGKVDNRHVVVDRGWLQLALSIYEEKMTDADVKSMFNKIAMPDKVIIMSRGVNECFAVYNNPNNPNSPDSRVALGSDYIIAWKEVYIHNFNLIKLHLEKSNIEIVEANINTNPNLILKDYEVLESYAIDMTAQDQRSGS